MVRCLKTHFCSLSLSSHPCLASHHRVLNMGLFHFLRQVLLSFIPDHFPAPSDSVQNPATCVDPVSNLLVLIPPKSVLYFLLSSHGSAWSVLCSISPLSPCEDGLSGSSRAGSNREEAEGQTHLGFKRLGPCGNGLYNHRRLLGSAVPRQ